MTFAIAGANGNSGRVIAETLLARGAKVRVILRDSSQAASWKTRGADVVLADLERATELTRALAGAAGAYLLIPPNFAAPSQRHYQERIARTFAQAIAESNIPRVVFLSGFAAHRDRDSGPLAGLHDAERLLGAIPELRLSAIRAGYFHENVIPLLGVVKDTGVLPSFFPGHLDIPMVGTRDVGQLAAELLLDDAAGSEVVELGSQLSHAQIASVLGRILDRPIRVDDIALDAVPPMLASLGFTADLTDLYVEMIAGICSGALVFEGTHRRVEARASIETLLRPLLTTQST